MKTKSEIFYTVHVSRGGEGDGEFIQYSAERYPSLADARVAGRRLNEPFAIRKVRVVTKSEMIHTEGFSK